jgi:SCY1-like protein 1
MIVLAQLQPDTAIPEASETLGITSPAQATLVNSAAGAAGALAGWAISSLGKKVLCLFGPWCLSQSRTF